MIPNMTQSGECQKSQQNQETIVTCRRLSKSLSMTRSSAIRMLESFRTPSLRHQESPFGSETLPQEGCKTDSGHGPESVRKELRPMGVSIDNIVTVGLGHRKVKG